MFDFEYSVFQVSPETQDQIGIKFGTEQVIYQKLANFMYKKDVHVKGDFTLGRISAFARQFLRDIEAT